jgi:hypothetical protein
MLVSAIGSDFIYSVSIILSKTPDFKETGGQQGAGTPERKKM